MWIVFGFGGCHDPENCPYCHGTRVERLTKRHETWTRVLDPDKILLPVDIEDLLFCMLHAELRTAEEFMEILTARMKIEPEGIDRIRQVANQLRLPYQLYDEDGEELWRISSFNGLQARRILQHIEAFAALWPATPNTNYHSLTRQELQDEISAAIKCGKLQKPKRMPSRKHDLIKLLKTASTLSPMVNETMLFTKVCCIPVSFSTLLFFFFFF